MPFILPERDTTFKNKPMLWEADLLTIRRASERGHADHGWLQSRHTFSFGGYHDPKHMGFSSLRVINDDTVSPGGGFATHGHNDMEIISYVLEGGLAHKDSMGNGSVIRPGDVQRMSAGTGVTHSEFNASNDEPVHFLQIWVLPEKRGLDPSYEQKTYSDGEKRNRLRLIGSHDGRDGSVTVHQDIDLYSTRLDEGEQVSHAFAAGRKGWIHVAQGSVVVNDNRLHSGDGAAVEDAAIISLTGASEAEVLLFDMT
jgi:redox-sensitive bicupin YhaK (pirin superfamily)